MGQERPMSENDETQYGDWNDFIVVVAESLNEGGILPDDDVAAARKLADGNPDPEYIQGRIDDLQSFVQGYGNDASGQ